MIGYGAANRVSTRCCRDGPERQRQLALALIVARLIDPAAKLATARALDETTALHSLGVTLGLGAVSAKASLCGTRLAGRGAADDRDGVFRQRMSGCDRGF